MSIHIYILNMSQTYDSGYQLVIIGYDPPVLRITEWLFRGIDKNRTCDTRIFSPLLYQLSYDTLFRAFCQTRTDNIFITSEVHYHCVKKAYLLPCEDLNPNSLNQNQICYHYITRHSMRKV